ncbi:MAG: PQQ-dependent sugar dehydrogenase, partial [Kordiimonas sp.]
LTHDGLLTVLKIFVISQAIVSITLMVITRMPAYVNTRRIILSLYGEVLLFAFVPLGIFLISTVPFDPQLYANAALLTFVFYVCANVFIAAILLGENEIGVLRRLGHILFSCISYLKTRLGFVILVAVTVPIVTAYMFMTDRGFADAVTQLRIDINRSDDTDWYFVDLHEGVRFTQPMMVRESPSGDMYVLERAGRIYRQRSGSEKEPELLIDITHRLGIVETENGAQGFDLHPDFEAGSPYLYLYYTDSTDSDVQTNRLSRFDLSTEDPIAAEFPLIEQERSKRGFHNGGTVVFGPDRYLYLSVGEMGDTFSQQFITKELMGGVLRIDVGAANPAGSHVIPKQPQNGKTQGYTIPNDNPFVGVDGALAEFFALGLRNPFRMDFDPETGVLWAGDVGSTEWEEVNIVVAGGNYQFPYVEGISPQSEQPLEIIGTEVEPAYYYRHSAYDRAVIGGTVYRGSLHPTLSGQYLFGDNYSGKISALPAVSSQGVTPMLLTQVNQVAQRGITSITQTKKGEILITTLGRSDQATGRVLKLISAEECEAISCNSGNVVVEQSTNTSDQQIGLLFKENCGRCHGDGGLGDGPDAADIDVAIPDFSDPDFHAGSSDGKLFNVIKHGGESEGLSYWMPPWDTILSDEEVEAMVQYVRSFNRDNPRSEHHTHDDD